MNTKTQQALKDSIAHWQRMLELKTLKQRVESREQPDAENCALCRLFFEGECQCCPVFTATKVRLCEGSDTYAKADRAFYTDDDKAWQRACKAQIAFLESLLPAKP